MNYNETLEYYNKHANRFASETLSVNFNDTQNKFLQYIQVSGMILDFGCGSGRDVKYFSDLGYQIEAIDGSMELCKIATEYSGIPVRQMHFEELSEHGKYDGVWACSSILHLPYKDLKQVILKIAEALKDKGICYTSFKYGEFEGERNGRYFTDMTEKRFVWFLQEIPEFKLVESWITADVRPGRSDEKWLNILLQKNKL